MRLAIMDTNAFNTIIAAVKGAVSRLSRPLPVLRGGYRKTPRRPEGRAAGIAGER